MRSIVAGIGACAAAFWTSLAIAAPCAGFTDVDSASPFCVNVEWLKARSITLGCTATLYCPNDPVTRLQMAAFLYRLGFLNAFLQGGNAFGTTAVFGTTDNSALDVRVNGQRAMRYAPALSGPNVLGGHQGNNVTGGASFASTIGGGGTESFPNVITASGGTVAGGLGNTAGLAASIGGGVSNTASGDYSTVGGGFGNSATANYSIAAGTFARANGADCAVFSLWAGPPGMQCFGVASQFNIGARHGMSIDYFSQRADGGGDRYLYIGDRFPPFTIVAWNGATLTDAGFWTNASDAAKKEGFAEVDTGAVLDRLAAMPIRSWRYHVEAEDVRHVGPTAQDFKAAFGLGHDDKSIGTIDADGVALAAIQGLNAKLERTVAEQAGENARLRADLRALREEIANLSQPHHRDESGRTRASASMVRPGL